MYKSKISKKAGNIKKEEEMRKIKIVKNIGNIITWIILVSFTTTSISWAGPLSLKQNHLRPISADESAVAKELAKDIPTANLTHGEVAHQLRNTSKYRDLYDVLGLEVTTMLLESAQYHGLPIEDIVKGLFSNDELDQRNAIQSFLDHQGENARASSGGKALVLGGGTGTEPSIKALRGLGYDVTGVLAAIDDGGASFDIIYSLAHYNHTRHGDFRDSYGRIPPLGDLASSLFKGFASSDKLYKILDDQGRIILLGDLVKQLEAEGRIRTNGDNIIFYGRSKKTPTFYMKIEDFNNHKESLVIFDKNGSIINYASTFKELLIALLKETVKSISEGKGVGHTASERNTDQTLSPGFVFFASSILNLAEIIDTKYFDTYIIRKKGASIRNLLLLAALDYVGLLVPGKGESSPWESAIATDGDKQCFQLALDALAEMADIKNGRVMLSHYDPTTVCAVYDANVIIVNQGTDRAGKEHLTAFTVKVDRNTGKMSVGIDDKKQLIAEDIEPGNTISYTTTVPEGSGLSPTVIEIKNDVGSITFKVNSSDSCEITEYNGNPATTYVNYGGVKRIVAQDGTGRAKYTSDKPDYELPADLPGELTENELPYYAPLKINGVDVYVRSRFVARQTNVTKTTVFSPLSKSVKFGRTQPSLTLPFEDVLNIRRDPSKSKVQKTYYYMQDLTQRVDANNELIEQILDENTNIIVIGPGSFLTSEVAHLLTKGLIEALASRCQRGDIPIIFVTNPNLTSETVGYDLKGLIERVEAIAKQLTGEDYHFGNIFNTLVAGDLDTVKLQKHLQGDADFVADEPIEASVCIRMIQENPLLLDNLNLDYIKYLIDDFLKRAKKGQVPAMEYILGAYPVFGEIDNRRRYIWAISDPNFLEEKLSIFDEDEKPLTARDDQGRVRQLTKPMTLLEYLRIKLQQLQDTLYEPSYAEILTSSDPRLRKSKKSQGPLTYKQSDIDALKEANPNLTIDSDVSMAGTRILPTREPGASSVLRVAFIDDLYAKAMQRAASRTIDTKSNDFVSYSLQEAIKVIRSGSPELAAAAANMVEERLLVLDIPVVKKGWVFNDETRTVSSTLLSRNIIEEVPSKILAAILVGLMEGANVFEQKGRLDHAKDAENNSVQAFLVKVGEFPEVADETLDVLKSRLSVASARSITQPDLIGALRILYPEEASDISSVSEANNMLLGDFRKEIETRFLNGHDIVDTQREKVTVVAQDRARRALVAMALALSKKQKQMKDIQKEDFDQLLGLRVAAGISGLGERFSPDTLVNKYWAGTNTGETYIRLAFTEAFDIWGVTPIACADRMAMNELLKPGITRADVEAAASAQ